MQNTLEKCPTGVLGLDEMLDGGIPREWVVLICGGPGAGKSTFSLQFMYNGIKQYGEKCLLVLLDTPWHHLTREFRTIGWDLEALQNTGKLEVIDSAPFREKTMTDNQFFSVTPAKITDPKFKVEEVIGLIESKIEKHKYFDRIVIDSLGGLKFAFHDEAMYRDSIRDLIDFLADTKSTTLISAELNAKQVEEEYHPEQFLTHGVVSLYFFKHKEDRIRAIEILKMRGVDHTIGLKPFKIEKDNGIVVQPKGRVYLIDKEK